MALLVKQHGAPPPNPLGAPPGASPCLALFSPAAVGMLVVAAIYLPMRRVDFRRATLAPKLAARGVLGAFGTAAYYLTLPALGAGKASLIGNTWVVWSSIMAVFVLGEPLTPRKLLGILIAIAGIVLRLWPHGDDRTRLGRDELLAIAAAFVAAVVVVIIRQLTLTESSGTIFASQCVYTLLLPLPFLIFQPLPSLHDTALLTAAALCAALGQLAMTEGFRYLPVSTGGAFQILLPLTITVAGMAFLGEAFTSAQVSGGLLILFGCYQTVAAKAAPLPRVRTT